MPRSEPPLPSPTSIPGWFTGPMSKLYGWELARRNRAYDAGRGVTRLDVPIVSIGNLSTGGTGKTPMVQRVVRMLQDLGASPSVAMRGYRAKPGEPSDEEREHGAGLPGVPIVAQADRIAGLLQLFESAAGEGVDCVVLDDGFQHRKLHRDVDIVLIDATRPPMRDRLLPRGHLREPVASLRRADVVIMTHAESVGPEVLAAMQRSLGSHLRSDAIVLEARHTWSGVRVEDEQSRDEPIDWLKGKRVVAACAIGNPGAFLSMLEDSGAEILGTEILKDHAQFAGAPAARIGALASQLDSDGIVVTEKDWAKLSTTDRQVWGVPVVVPNLDMEISQADHKLLLAAFRTVLESRERRTPRLG